MTQIIIFLNNALYFNWNKLRILKYANPISLTWCFWWLMEFDYTYFCLVKQYPRWICLVKLPLLANKLASYIVTSRDVRGIPSTEGFPKVESSFAKVNIGRVWFNLPCQGKFALLPVCCNNASNVWTNSIHAGKWIFNCGLNEFSKRGLHFLGLGNRPVAAVASVGLASCGMSFHARNYLNNNVL